MKRAAEEEQEEAKEEEEPQDEGEGEKKTIKRVRLDVPDDAEEEGEDGEKEREEGEVEQVKDPREQEIDDIAKELGDVKDDEFEVVIGPVASASNPASATASGDGPGASSTKRAAGLPAFRFSGSSLTASLSIPITPEQEEAMRVMGVTAQNYAQLMNPGKMARRRSALEDDLDEIEHAKWRDPGAVQSDFFNYGLNEHTWKEYAARQVALRLYRLQKLHEQNHANHNGMGDRNHDTAMGEDEQFSAFGATKTKKRERDPERTNKNAFLWSRGSN